MDKMRNYSQCSWAHCFSVVADLSAGATVNQRLTDIAGVYTVYTAGERGLETKAIELEINNIKITKLIYQF